MYPSHALEFPSDPARSAGESRRRLLEFHERWRRSGATRLEDFPDPLSPVRRLPDDTPVLLLGANQGFAWAFIEAAVKRLNVIGVVDDFRPGQTHAGVPISAGSDVAGLIRGRQDAIAVNLAIGPAGIRHFDVLAARHGMRCLSLYQALRAFGMKSVHFSGDDIGEKTLEHLERSVDACERFADDLSRYTAYQVLLFRISLDRAFARSVCIGIENLIFCPSLLSLSDKEVFVDGGAYNGDTIDLFHKATGGWYRRIHAFEPDRPNFEELRRKVESKPDIRVYMQGLADRSRAMRFASMGSPGSHVTDEGDSSIDLVALDETVEEPVTFIKLNVEGAENLALDGAARSITRCRPNMAISVDHLGDDLVTIPEKIASFDADYDIFIRHHTYEYFGAYLYARPR